MPTPRTLTIALTLALTLGCTNDNSLAEQAWARAVCQATVDLDDAPLDSAADQRAAFTRYAAALADLDPPSDLNPEATETYESIRAITRTEPTYGEPPHWVGSVLAKVNRLMLQGRRDIPLLQIDPWEPKEDEGFPCEILRRRYEGNVVTE